MNNLSYWRHGILARSLVAVIVLAVLLGGFSLLLVRHTVGERVQRQAVVGLGELLDTVENTASIACFVGDEQLAREVAQGLLRNSDVLRVVIRSGGVELARAEREAESPAKDGADNPQRIVRAVLSPFNRQEKVGEIRLDGDWAAIHARVKKNADYIVSLLALQLALIVAAIAALLVYLVVRPITAVSDGLHRLDAAGGQRLRVPAGQERSEIGRLVGDINDLSGALVATLNEERQLRKQQAVDQRKYQDLFDNSASGIFVAESSGALKSFNRSFVELTWLPRSGKTAYALQDTGWSEPQALLELIRASLAGHIEVEDDFLLVGRRGDERWLHIAVLPLGDDSVQGTVTDVTLRKREELSARRLAVTDSLTGFANRDGLIKKLGDLDPATSPPFALVLLDLDGFKQFNDAWGFPVGNQLLLKMAARIRDTLADDDRAARIGGDDFVVLLADEDGRPESRQRVTQHLAGLVNLLNQPYPLDHATALLGASLGVAFFPGDGLELNMLLRHAELALNTARHAGGRTYRFFDPAQLAAVEHRRRLEDDLRLALAENQLYLVFQPIVDLAAGRLAGAEALLRWEHPERGFTPPDVFIPLAEEIGLVSEFGLLVLEQTCRHVAEWRRNGIPDLYVSINVSVRQIPDKLTLAIIQDALSRHGLTPNALALEITEGVLLTDVAVAQRWIDEMRAAGLRIYLDDFGTGYSSLSYLKRFQMDTVKIDKSFIRDMHGDASDRALVDAIVTMARSLGLKVVAEGVEEAGQLAILRDMGCAYIQGYYFSRPVNAGDFLPVATRINALLAGDVSRESASANGSP